MNRDALKQKLESVMDGLLREKGYLAPVEILMGADLLTPQQYESWRSGRVPYLEKACASNLNQLSYVMKEIRIYALANHLKPSSTAYNQWGVKGRKIPLRFSKTGQQKIEEAYATHYVADKKREDLTGDQ